jgi:DNA-binding GntR family transcriptional regulator
MTMTLDSTQKTLRLTTQVYEAIKREIIRGGLAPDSQLSEADLSDRFGVSRTPVREALIRLAEDEMVKIVPRVGTFVAPISIEFVLEAQFLREHIECALMEDVCRHISPEDVARLAAIVDRQRRLTTNVDKDEFLALDEEFHSMLATVSHHPGAWRIIQQSKAHLDRARYLSLKMPLHMGEIVAQHDRIVDAVRRRDASTAEAAMRIHVREILATLEKIDLTLPAPR